MLWCFLGSPKKEERRRRFSEKEGPTVLQFEIIKIGPAFYCEKKARLLTFESGTRLLFKADSPPHPSEDGEGGSVGPRDAPSPERGGITRTS